MSLIKRIYNTILVKTSIIIYGYVRGKNVSLAGNVILKNKVIIGDNSTLLTSNDGEIIISECTSVGKDSWIASGSGKILIGQECIFGPRVTIVGQNHALKDVTTKNYLPWDLDDDGHETELGIRCHVGANVTIVPGVKIGDYCVIAANSVVTKNFGSGSIIAGNPARLLKIKNISKDINESSFLLPPFVHTSRKFWN
jgi:acetyltransferase-like isoleucine patch superfamily enzyme